MDNLVVNRKSWHYRVLRTAKDFFNMHSNDPKTLCAYFWSWAWFVPWFFVFAAGIAATLAGLIALIPGLFWSWLHNGSHTAAQVLALLGGISIFVILVALIRAAFKLAAEKVGRSVHKPPTNLSAADVVVRGMVATKRKFCPYIDYR